MPSQRLNTQGEDEIIRIDEQGRQWLQEEVRKPAYPKPRGRRVLTYMETGTQTQTVKNGEYVESFEVAGVGAGIFNSYAEGADATVNIVREYEPDLRRTAVYDDFFGVYRDIRQATLNSWDALQGAVRKSAALV